ncbi:hypothetical protein AGMMS49982_17520 [Bacteroidia bacterium]|nr:hypothetical protein AGMMS49982_17520 [Bacteroidia bacterium]
MQRIKTEAELSAKLQLIEELAAIAILPHNLINEQLLEIYKKIGKAKNANDNRNVFFVNVTFEKIVRHKGIDTKKIIPQLREIFEKSVPIYSESEILKAGHKVHSNFIGYHNYLGKIQINGIEYYVRFTVQELTPSIKKGETEGKLQLHSTAISDVELYEKENIAISNPLTRAPDGNIVENSLSVTTEDYSIGNVNNNRFVDAKLQHFFELARKAQELYVKV